MTRHTKIGFVLAAIGLVAILGILTAGAAAVNVSSEQITVDDGQTVTVDVEVTDEFINDSQTSTSVDVQLKDDTGTVVNSTTLTVEDTAFNGTYSGSDTVFRTADFSPAAGSYTVVVNATAQDYVASTDTEVPSATTGGGLLGGGGIIAGAGSTQLIAFGAIIAGLAYAYRKDWL
ncbi:hypothetical protein GRX03_11950 [Halovenus sp. WSH3]|uniref:Uncharacterized protein n=1 Tax=Halovenus carboxidivorans TaxID=2692199 RepID=A0A6B0TAB2_9EURY|nr:hypothetical protein [Halovenus carboxidivorans]MXR52312.1 hypothetical protein [Halovenus carboxidivorans]